MQFSSFVGLTLDTFDGVLTYNACIGDSWFELFVYKVGTQKATLTYLDGLKDVYLNETCHHLFSSHTLDMFYFHNMETFLVVSS